MFVKSDPAVGFGDGTAVIGIAKAAGGRKDWVNYEGD